MLWCQKSLKSEIDMNDRGGWHVDDVIFIIRKVFTLNIPKRVQSSKGSNDLVTCILMFVGSQ